MVGNAWSATLDIGAVGMTKLNDGDGTAVISTPNIRMKLAKFESEDGRISKLLVGQVSMTKPGVLDNHMAMTNMSFKQNRNEIYMKT